MKHSKYLNWLFHSFIPYNYFDITTWESEFLQKLRTINEGGRQIETYFLTFNFKDFRQQYFTKFPCILIDYEEFNILHFWRTPQKLDNRNRLCNSINSCYRRILLNFSTCFQIDMGKAFSISIDYLIAYRKYTFDSTSHNDYKGKDLYHSQLFDIT